MHYVRIPVSVVLQGGSEANEVYFAVAVVRKPNAFLGTTCDSQSSSRIP
jgi:hypothetical protein